MDKIPNDQPVQNVCNISKRNNTNQRNSPVQSFYNQEGSPYTVTFATMQGIKFVPFNSIQSGNTEKRRYVDSLKSRTNQRDPSIVSKKQVWNIQQISQPDVKPKDLKNSRDSEIAQNDASKIQSTASASQKGAWAIQDNYSSASWGKESEILFEPSDNIQQIAQPDAKIAQSDTPAIQDDFNYAQLEKEADELVEQLNQSQCLFKKDFQRPYPIKIEKLFIRYNDCPENISREDELPYYLQIFKDYLCSGIRHYLFERLIFQKIIILAEGNYEFETAYKFASAALGLKTLGPNNLTTALFFVNFYTNKSPEKAEDIINSFMKKIHNELMEKLATVEGIINRNQEPWINRINLLAILLVKWIKAMDMMCPFKRLSNKNKECKTKEYYDNLIACEKRFEKILEECSNYISVMGPTEIKDINSWKSIPVQAMKEGNIISHQMYQAIHNPDAIKKVACQIESFIKEYPTELKALFMLIKCQYYYAMGDNEQTERLLIQVKNLRKRVGNCNKSVELAIFYLTLNSGHFNKKEQCTDILEWLYQNEKITDEEKKFFQRIRPNLFLNKEDLIQELLLYINQRAEINEQTETATGEDARNTVCDNDSVELHIFDILRRLHTISKVQNQDERIPSIAQNLKWRIILSKRESERVKLQPEDLEFFICLAQKLLKSDEKILINHEMVANISANESTERDIAGICIDFANQLELEPDFHHSIETGLVILLILRQIKNLKKDPELTEEKAAEKPCDYIPLEKNIATALSKKDRIEEAIQLLDKLLERCSDDSIINRIGEYSFYYAKQLSIKEEYDLAEIYFNKAKVAFYKIIGKISENMVTMNKIAHLEYVTGNTHIAKKIWEGIQEKKLKGNTGKYYSSKDKKIKIIQNDEFHLDEVMARSNWNKNKIK